MPLELSALVHVIDDDEAVCDSLSLLFKSAGYAVETYRSAGAFLQEARSRHPACVVADMRMPGLSGLELTEQLRRHGRSERVIILTGHGTVAMGVNAIKSGAVDFLEKPCPPQRLLAAVGEALLAGERGSRQAEPGNCGEFAWRVAQLSPQEYDVLAGLVRGYTNEQIAAALDISVRTVQNRRGTLLTHLGVASRQALMEQVLLANWTPTTGPFRLPPGTN